MKVNTLKTGIAFTFALLAGIGSTQAQERKERQQTPPSIAELIKQMDANEDGKLSLKEVKGPLQKDFKKIDLNEDGFLTKEELEKAPKPKGRPQERK